MSRSYDSTNHRFLRIKSNKIYGKFLLEIGLLFVNKTL